MVHPAQTEIITSTAAMVIEGLPGGSTLGSLEKCHHVVQYRVSIRHDIEPGEAGVEGTNARVSLSLFEILMLTTVHAAQIAQASIAGKNFPKIDVVVFKTFGAGLKEVLRITLQDCRFDTVDLYGTRDRNAVKGVPHSGAGMDPSDLAASHPSTTNEIRNPEQPGAEEAVTRLLIRYKKILVNHTTIGPGGEVKGNTAADFDVPLNMSAPAK